MKTFEVRINGTHDTADDVMLALTCDGMHYPPDTVRVREMPIVADRVLANGARGVFVEIDRYMKVVHAMRKMRCLTGDEYLMIADAARQMLEDLGEVR